MTVCKRSLEIDCRLEEAFDFVALWSNLKDFMPMFVDLRPVSLVHYGQGLSLETKIALGEVQVSTTLDLVEFDRYKRILYKSARGIRSKLSWEFSKLPRDNTLVSFTFEYEIPPALVTYESEKEALSKRLQETANKSADMLKWILEMKDKEGS